jgi:phage major head subunit gpT-like protein
MAIITPSLLLSLRTGLVKIFQDTMKDTPTDWQRIATLVPSSTASNTYGWLGEFPGLREWIGDRVIKDMKAQGYVITNRLFEGTVGVKRTDIEDDNLGIYTPMTQEQGRAAKVHPDELVFDVLKAGHTSECYDGQNFFDTDHPVYPNVDGTGTAQTVSNVTAGSGEAWYLLDTSRPLKPIIFQERLKPELQALMSMDDERVFMSDLFRFGIRARGAAGFGFWQMAHKSQAALDGASFAAARTSLEMMKADGGRPLGLKPTLLVVPPTLRSQAEALILADKKDGGGTNTNYKAVELLVTPWVA